jgi:hypothetical protein
VTTPGLLLIPLSLLLVLLPWRHSFVVLFIYMMLPDVAVLIAGSFGVSAAFFYGNLMIGRCAVELVLGKRGLNRKILEDLYPLLLFFAIDIVVLWIALSSFQGKVDVVTGTMGFNLNLAQPYHLARENFTQLFYLAFHILLIYAMAHQLMRMEYEMAARIANRAVTVGGLVAAGAVFWEMAAFYGGVYFPDWFFHSDAHSGAWGQVTGGSILRASGSFSEPSGVGFAFAGFLLYAWKRYKLRSGSRVFSMAFVLTCLVVMAASTATTAFAAMALFFAVAAKDLLGAHVRVRRTRTGLQLGDFAAVGLLAATVFGIVLYLSANWETVNQVLTRAVYEKDQTGSFTARTSTDLMAVDILFETGGLGLGLGSHKPSSAVMTVLSNTGIAGFLVLGAFLFMRIRRYRGPRIEPDPNLTLIPLQWLLIGYLFAHTISNPNLSSMGVWMACGLLIGLNASIERRTAAWAIPLRDAFGRPGAPDAGAAGATAGERPAQAGASGRVRKWRLGDPPRPASSQGQA